MKPGTPIGAHKERNAFIHSHLSFLVPEELPCVFYHLLIGELGVGLLLAEVEDFPQRHAEGPNVTRCGKLPLHRKIRGAHVEMQCERTF